MEVFVQQVVDRIQGVIEAKLTPSQPTPISVLSPAYPGFSYQSLSFYPSHYTNISTAARLQSRRTAV